MTEPNTFTAKDWFDRGISFKRTGDVTSALDAFRRSIKINSTVAAPWISIAQLLNANNQLEEGRQCLIRAVMADPKNVMARQHLASAHLNLGYIDAAKQEYSNTIKLDPRSTAAHLGLGQLFEDIGQPQDAAKAYRKVVELNPKKHVALANILGLGRHVDITAERHEAEQLIHSLATPDKALVGYGLGKSYQQDKKIDKAFNAFTIANTARKHDSAKFNSEALNIRINTLIKIFSSAFFKQRENWGHESAQPIFIVGLPRSGTTLTEQILDSHSQCFGAGELADLSDLATGMPDRIANEKADWPECAPVITQQQIYELAQDYLAAAAKRAPQSAIFIIDKQPLNFWHLGLIAIAMPKAKIIHCQRDIRDCGLSIYTQNFSHQQNWSTDLTNIGAYWQGYRRLMKHFQAVSGLDILDVNYEETITDLPKQAKAILNFIGLPWEDEVLQFHTTQRAVQTPSKWQVRQPIYKTSVAKWRAYEKYLRPLIDAAADSQ
jgi:tetratricopeptide (TPR) repeat protein